MKNTESKVRCWNMVEIDTLNYRAIDLLEKLGQKQPSQHLINIVERILKKLELRNGNIKQEKQANMSRITIN